MLNQIGFKSKIFGRYGGGSLHSKLLASCERISELSGSILQFNPDYAISFSSPECARIAFGIGVPHICVSDSPHAESVSRLTLPLSHTLFTPWIIPLEEWTKYGISKDRIVRYRALDASVWIKRQISERQNLSQKNKRKRTLTVRMEEAKASYLHGYDTQWSNDLLQGISKLNCNVTILCRYEEQIEYIKKKYGSRFTVPQNLVPNSHVLSQTNFFIGMGGTMTAEASLMGIPTISAFPGKETIVDRYLVKMDMISKPNRIDGILKRIEEMFVDKNLNMKMKNKAKKMLDEMEDPITKIADAVEAIGKS